MKKYQILLTTILLIAVLLTGCERSTDRPAASISPDVAVSGIRGDTVSSGDTSHESSDTVSGVSAETPIGSHIPADDEENPSSVGLQSQSSPVPGGTDHGGQPPSQTNGNTPSSPATRSPSGTASSPANSSRAHAPRATSSNATSSKSASTKPKESASSAPAKKPATITVTLSVDCKTAVAYGNELAASISNNGVILAGKKITLDQDATVYDALKKSGLVIGTRSSAAGQYVYSIQSLQEKACGGKSGWVYFVNGGYVNKSSSSCTLKDGDNVQWRYTCNNGKDL